MSRWVAHIKSTLYFTYILQSIPEDGKMYNNLSVAVWILMWCSAACMKTWVRPNASMWVCYVSYSSSHDKVKSFLCWNSIPWRSHIGKVETALCITAQGTRWRWVSNITHWSHNLWGKSLQYQAQVCMDPIVVLGIIMKGEEKKKSYLNIDDAG